MPSYSLHWRHKRPKEYFPACVKLFGKPTAISTAKHGFAFWKSRGLFDEHLLRDEDVKHCVPRPHHDYFYSSVKFYVPKDKFCDVLKVSGSLAYDGLKKLLTARCGGIGANYATIYLGMMIANGKLSLKQVQANDMYPKMIRGELIPHDKLHSIMFQLKRENHKKYAKELDADFARYAFDKCYSKSKSKSKTHKRRGSRAKTTRKHTSTSKGKRRGGAAKKTLKNTRNQSCAGKGIEAKHTWTACCPHMPPDDKGRYRATTEMTVLPYDGKKYELWTCCKMCAESMIKTAKNKAAFKKAYIHSFDDSTMVAKNQHTGKPVQRLVLHK
jgi:hypothetical protein